MRNRLIFLEYSNLFPFTLNFIDPPSLKNPNNSLIIFFMSYRLEPNSWSAIRKNRYCWDFSALPVCKEINSLVSWNWKRSVTWTVKRFLNFNILCVLVHNKRDLRNSETAFFELRIVKIVNNINPCNLIKFVHCKRTTKFE